MLCKRCSFNNQEGSVFCSGCGANLKEADSVTISKPVSAPVTQPADNGLEMPKNTKHDYSVQPGVNALSEAPKISGEVPPAYTPPVYSAPVTPVYTAPVYGAPVSPYGGYQDQSSRVIGETKRSFGSPLMIAGSVALTLSVLMSICSYFMNLDFWKWFMRLLLAPFLEDADLTPKTYENLTNLCDGLAIGVGILVVGFALSLVAGLLLTVAQRFTNSPSVETYGLACIKSTHRSYITIASCSIGYLVLLAFRTIIEYSQQSDYDYSFSFGYGYVSKDEILLNSLIFIIVMLAIAILYVITYAGANGSMSRCESSMKYSGAPFYASTFTAVMLLIFAVLSVIALMLAANNGSGYAQLFGEGLAKTDDYVSLFFTFMIQIFSLDVCSVIATIFFIISSVCFSISIFIQRANMLRIYYETKRSGL